MLLDCLLAGGAERIAVEVACALDRDRFEPSVIVTRYGGPLAEHLERASVPYTVLDRRHGFAPRKYLRAHRLVRDVDLIHAHKLGSNLWGTLLARTTGVPLVVREPTFSGTRTPLRTAGYRWWVAHTARRVICPSPIVAASLIDDGFRPEQIELIPNGVRLDAALPRAEARAELGLPPDGFVVGIVARLREEKAHEVLLRAAARLRDAGRELTVCIVGDGPERPALEGIAHDLGLDETVVWTGERADAKRLPRAFDVGVICSDWEGLPVAALEILAAGTPLVATAVGALPDVVDGAGAIVPVRDDEALALAIGALMDDPVAAARAGERGRAVIRDRFSFESMVRGFERVYDEVLAVAGRDA